MSKNTFQSERPILPLMMQLENEPIVVIGGGRVATRRIRTLLSLQLPIIVISPRVTLAITKWNETGELHWRKKHFSLDDTSKARIIIAATNNKEVNLEVYRKKRHDQLVNIVDEPTLSDFHFPAICSRGKLLIAISTTGASPTLTKHIKERIDAQIPANYDQYVDFLANCRNIIKKSKLPKESQQTILKTLLKERFVSICAEERQALFNQLLAEESRKFNETR